MRVFIAVLVLIFSLQTWTKADDIRDFEIEGMSIGESLLDYYSEEEIRISIKKKYYAYLPEKKFIDLEFNSSPNFKTYDALQISIKPNDSKYIIYAVDGILKIEDMNNCNKKINEVSVIISNQFIDATKVKQKKTKHRADQSGKSTTWGVAFFLNEGGSVSVRCYDWHKDIGYFDSFRISMRSFELNEWLGSGG